MQKTFLTAAQAMADMKKIGSPEKAAASTRFFKTGKGQYSYGDVFIGLTAPEERVIAKKYAGLPLLEIEKLLTHKVHEFRLVALLLLDGQYSKSSEKEQKKIVDFYLAHLSFVNNWDLVDSSARYILGDYLRTRNRKVLYKLAKSKNLWERRVAIVATHAFILENDFADTLAIARILFSDTEDLLHKATGWMLREVGKRDEQTLVAFLEAYATEMPRTTLRYAIERFPEPARKGFLARR